MIKRLTRTASVFILTLVLAVSAVVIYVTDPTVPADDPADPEENTVETVSLQTYLGAKGKVYATILGDSIAKGYSPGDSEEIVPYGNLVMEKVKESKNIQYDVSNFAKNGLDSRKMNEEILTDEQVRQSLSASDVVFITLGSNDLLNEFKSSVQEILDTDSKIKSVGEAKELLAQSVSENPLLILGIIDAMKNWDYQSFENEWIRMMETIDDLQKEDARIIVTNIYNPVENEELPSTMNRGVEDVIRNMNEIIVRNSEKYGYQVADLYDSDIYDHLQRDGLHPDQSGQQMIADIIQSDAEQTLK